ncbi:hypothetical protein ACFE04_003947 [Oxalis oulophora]
MAIENDSIFDELNLPDLEVGQTDDIRGHIFDALLEPQYNIERYPKFSGDFSFSDLDNYFFNFNAFDKGDFSSPMPLSPLPQCKSVSEEGSTGSVTSKTTCSENFAFGKTWKNRRNPKKVGKRAWKPKQNKANNQGLICFHCQAVSTPQWRRGPFGRKTLCNACGMRHKEGRLLPEYRPAASPTFDETRHSNSHRKIVKKRISE